MSRSAWAIKINSGFAGVFFFATKLEPWHDGMRTALWSTRRAARNALAEKFPQDSYAQEIHRPRVVRVRIRIEAIE